MQKNSPSDRPQFLLDAFGGGRKPINNPRMKSRSRSRSQSPSRSSPGPQFDDEIPTDTLISLKLDNFQEQVAQYYNN